MQYQTLQNTAHWDIKLILSTAEIPIKYPLYGITLAIRDTQHAKQNHVEQYHGQQYYVMQYQTLAHWDIKLILSTVVSVNNAPGS